MVDASIQAKKLFKPYTEIRLQKEIHSFEEDIEECYKLSHDSEYPKNAMVATTPYGLWLHGSCPHCNYPIDNWYHPHNCGNCGVNLNWLSIQHQFEKSNQ